MTFSALQSVSGTLVASTQQTFTFGDNTANVAIRYAYVAVNNTGTTVLYARTDGTAATVGGDMCVAVEPGTVQVVANELPLWTEAANVIQSGKDVANPLVAGQPGWPGTPATQQPLGTSAYGQKASPGTTVSVISSGTPTFTISGTG